MTEKPIIFSAPMVRAILAGRKTMTRRLLHYQRDWPGEVKLIGGELFFYPSHPSRKREPALMAHPRYESGMRLWVRETSIVTERGVFYRADGLERLGGHKWTPSIYMRREHSRLTLEVTAVCVERLQDITEADARDEGVDELDGEIDEVALCAMAKRMGSCATDSKVWFAVLWDSINGKRAAWASNPWVAVVEFKRVKPSTGTDFVSRWSKVIREL